MHILGHSNYNNVILYSPQNLVEINVSLAADQDRHLLRLWISWYPPKALQFWSLPLLICWCEKVKVLNLYQFSRCCVNLCILIFSLYFSWDCFLFLFQFAFSDDKPPSCSSSHVLLLILSLFNESESLTKLTIYFFFPITCFPWCFAFVMLLPHHALFTGGIWIMYFISMVRATFYLLSYKALLRQTAFSFGS